MYTFKEFLVESELDLITEAKKADIIAYMQKKEWGDSQAYSFGKEAVRDGIFKTEMAAGKAFDKYFDEYKKAGKFNVGSTSSTTKPTSKAKTSKPSDFKPSAAATKAGVGIGDLVWLRKPVKGVYFAQITGYNIDKKDVKNSGAPIGKFAGSKVDTFDVKLKETPYASNDFVGTAKLKPEDFVNITGRGQQEAINWWSANIGH